MVYGSFVVDRFYVALFSALEQTHCARIYDRVPSRRMDHLSQSPVTGVWIIYHRVPSMAYGSSTTVSLQWCTDHLPQCPFNGVWIIYHGVSLMVYGSFTTVSLQWRMDNLPQSPFNGVWIIYHRVPSMAYGSFTTVSLQWRMDHLPQSPFSGVSIYSRVWRKGAGKRCSLIKCNVKEYSLSAYT